MLKAFLSEAQDGIRPHTWWSHEFAGHNKEATLEVKALFGGETPFDTAKPVKLVKRMLEPIEDKNALVLDFFVGSGTTAQAVLELNKEDGGNRRFILVQLPEPTGREDFATIAEITKERVRRVIKRMEGERSGELPIGDGTKTDLGFKVFKLAESNFAIWNPALAATEPGKLAEKWKLSADNVRADAGETALLYELMLKSGLPLDTPAETKDVDGARVHLLDEGRMLTCIARDLTREQLQRRAEGERRPRIPKPRDQVSHRLNFISDEAPKSEIILYNTEDGKTRLDVKIQGETAWLSLNQMAELFQRDKSVISKHIRNLFEEGELRAEGVVANFATTAADGKTYQVDYYNLDVIISVGYRVKSNRGTQFRIWATQRLREYIVKGFTMDDERLKQSGGGDYFDELCWTRCALTICGW